jgi:hypothetical protein
VDEIEDKVGRMWWATHQGIAEKSVRLHESLQGYGRHRTYKLEERRKAYEQAIEDRKRLEREHAEMTKRLEEYEAEKKAEEEQK